MGSGDVIVGGEVRTVEAVRLALEANVGNGGGAIVYLAPQGSPPGIASLTPGRFASEVGGGLMEAFQNLREGAASLRAAGRGGSIVFVAPPAIGRAFDAVRQGLRLMVKAAALELGPEGIRVNTVLPGGGGAANGRAAEPADIAAAVAFVASDRAAFMTGADLVVDGGEMAR